jgi:hypothetical protein
MKKISLISLLIITSVQVFGQWEYSYFAFKLGASHNFFSPQQTTAGNMVVRNENDNFIQLYTAKELNIAPKINYTADPVFEFQFHYDFQNERQGVIFAVNYSALTISQFFYTKDSEKPALRRNITLNSVGFPLIMKFGDRIFAEQRYFFAGMQLNFNHSIKIKEEVPWSVNPYIRNGEKDEFVKQSYSLILGFNYLIFNLQLNYLPNSFLNKHFVNEDLVAVYSQQKGDIFYIKTSFVFPLTPWLSTKNYWLFRLKQNLKIW